MHALRVPSLLWSVLALWGSAVGCSMNEPADAGQLGYPLDDVLRLDHIQVKGTHNSYHLRPNDEPAVPWDYDMPTITDQLELYGVRQIELDFWYDREEETFEVFHAALFDPETTCGSLASCLGEVNDWSAVNPDHLPVFALLEVKNSQTEEVTADPEGFIRRFEEEIEGIFGRERLLTPAEVKGDAATLQEAVAEGWPTLGEVRGQVVVVVWDEGPITTTYSHDNSHLDDRLMFVRGRTDFGFGVVSAKDDITGGDGYERAVAEVERGVLVRTRADTDGNEALAGDMSRFEQALEAGCHMISTDFPRGTEHEGYVIDMPEGGPVRCNPRRAPPECTSDALERF